MQTMLRHKTKVGTVTPSVSSEINGCSSRNKSNKKMSVKVTTISRNSLNRIKMLYPIRQNNMKSTVEHHNLFDHSHLREMTAVVTEFHRTNPTKLSFIQMSELSLIQPIHINNSTIIESAESSRHLLPTTSLRKPFLTNNQFTFETAGSNEDELHKRKYDRRRFCAYCSNCCCLACMLGLLFFIFGLAALLVYIFTRHSPTTTTTITIVTTTSRTTATSTTATTGETTTTPTSTISTSTSSISSTLQTTTGTATTTPTPPCSPISVGSVNTLYSTTTSPGNTYQCFAYEWTSPTTGLVTINFQFRNDPSLWYLDDVSVYEGATQMIINGGFESGSFSPWVRTALTGSCGAAPGRVSSSSPKSGTYNVDDGCTGRVDQISQQFTATLGQVYVVSFWLKSGSSASGISALVTLS